MSSKHVLKRPYFYNSLQVLQLAQAQIKATKEMQKNDYPLQKDRFGKRGAFSKDFWALEDFKHN